MSTQYDNRYNGMVEKVVRAEDGELGFKGFFHLAHGDQAVPAWITFTNVSQAMAQDKSLTLAVQQDWTTVATIRLHLVRNVPAKDKEGLLYRGGLWVDGVKIKDVLAYKRAYPSEASKKLAVAKEAGRAKSTIAKLQKAVDTEEKQFYLSLFAPDKRMQADPSRYVRAGV